MPSTLLLIPSIGKRDLLCQRIAGLSYGERLYHLAVKSGIRPVFIVSQDSSLPKELGLSREYFVSGPSELQCDDVSRVIVLRPGILPDLGCLKELVSAPCAEGEFLDLDGIVVFRPSEGCFELTRAFVSHGYQVVADFLKGFLKQKISRCPAGRLLDITRLDRKQVEKALLKGLIKDTEGFMSKYFERRISLFITSKLIDTSITPNQITLISIVIGLIGALFISFGPGPWQIAGALLFLLHSIVDGCDGEIARLKFLESRLGGILDFWGDNIVHGAIFGAIGWEWAKRTGQSLPLYLAFAAIVGTFVSAFIVYLSTMKDKEGDGPLYTSVADSKKGSRLVKIADYLSRRDFIYLVVILAFYHHLDWFLMAASAGSLIFAGVLIWIRVKG